MKKKIIISFFLIMALLVVQRGLFAQASPFDVLWDSDANNVKAGDNFELNVTIRAPQDHYLYADETEIDFLSLDGIIIKDIVYPDTIVHEDPFFQKKVKVYEGDVLIYIRGRVPAEARLGLRDLVAHLRFRGCSPKACFRPQEMELPFVVVVKAPSYGTASSPERTGELKTDERAGKVVIIGSPGFFELFKSTNFGLVMERGFLLTLLVVFIAGLLTSLTPCIWPILPVILLYVGIHPHKKFIENILLSVSLVLGIVLVYSILGIIAVAFGKNFGFLFQHRIFLALVVLFFILMSLSMFGLFEFRLPHKWQGRLHKLGGKGYRGAFLAGMGIGLMASPCSGPVLASLLGFVAIRKDYLGGFALIFIYGLGMGLLMIVLATGLGEALGRFKKGAWMLWVRRFLGLILLLPAVFYMGSLIDVSDLKSGGDNRPKIEWIKNEADALKFASMTKRPIMVAFGAKWCPPCIGLERSFFARSDIVSLSYRIVPLLIDVTIENDEVKKLIEKYRVSIWPSVVFLDSAGSQYDDLKVSGADEKAIEANIHEALRRSGQIPR